MEADALVRKATTLSSELSTLLPNALSAISTQSAALKTQQAELTAREANLQKLEAALKARESAVKAREEKCAKREAECEAASTKNQEGARALGEREQDLLRKQESWTATTKSTPPPRSADGSVDSLQMQVLARATATALLKHGIASARAARATTDASA
jgi:DNA repair exonuclease SbcCD ATPase subunit